MLEHPFTSGLGGVGFETLPESLPDGGNHLALKFRHPEFYTSILGIDSLNEVNLLLLGRNASPDSVVSLEIEIRNTLKHFLQVRAHLSNFLGLRENLEEIVVGQEVETAEESAFLLEVILETLLDKFEVLVAVLEALLASFNGALDENLRVLDDRLHDGSPLDVDTLESLTFSLELLLDIRGVEHGLQVDPMGLRLHPSLERV